jgi:hypothetical protein
VDQTGTVDTNFTPGADAVSRNVPAIRRLLALRNPRPGQQEFVQARISPEGAVGRMKLQTNAVLALLGRRRRAGGRSGSRTPAGATALTTDLQALNVLATAWETAVGDTAKAAALTPLVAKARQVQAPGRHPLLHEGGSAKAYHDLNELLGEVINLGTDNGPGRRMLYAAHAYNVLDVNLAGRDGGSLAIGPDEVASRAGDIDPIRSTVVMQNPHAGNEPDLEGTGPVDTVNEGEFTLTLDQFLRNADMLRYATVESSSTSPVGDFPEPSSDTAMA